MAGGPMPYDLETERQKSSAFDRGLLSLVRGALADRSLIWFSAVGSLGMWAFAIAHPEPLRLAAAAGYSILSYLPLAWRK